jgi:Fe-S-cluster-containing dehydrogenase component
MKTYGMIIDLDKCSGCYNFFLACRDEHHGIDFLPSPWPSRFRDISGCRSLKRKGGSTLR